METTRECVPGTLKDNAKEENKKDSLFSLSLPEDFSDFSNWPNWIRQFERFRVAARLDKKDEAYQVNS